MSDEITPPPIVAPPPMADGAFSQPNSQFGSAYQPPWERPPEPPKARSAKKSAPVVSALKTIGVTVLTFLKFAKLGKIALTAGSMVLSIWLYAQIFGAWFAVGFVVLIFVHEMGHVWAAYKMGIRVSAPIFIPFLGAVILTNKLAAKHTIIGTGGPLHGSVGNKPITQDAIIGIGGPILGTVGAAACVGIYEFTGSMLMLALGYAGFFINLFNLTPVYPLDGGWIVRAISPILWLVGILVLLYLMLTGRVTNPLIFILIILGIPTMITELRAFFKRIPSPVPTAFRWKMGAAYVALLGVCAIGMSASRAEIELMRQHPAPRSRGVPGPSVASHQRPANPKGPRT